MRAPALWLLVSVVLARSGVAVASGADTTIVQGVLPSEIVGRWLVVVHASPSARLTNDPPPPGAAALEMKQTGSGDVPMVRTWELRRNGASFAMTVHRGQLPLATTSRVASGTPDAATMAEIEAAWPSLAAATGEPKTIETQLLDRPGDGFLVVTNEDYTPGTGLLRNSATYAVTTRTRDRLAGHFAGAMVIPAQMRGAIALPPVPVGLEGEFVAYRIPEAGTASVLDRVLGLFSGCGRRER